MNVYWLSIDEYSRVHNTSISTIRRRIKNKQVEARLEDGKYLISSEMNTSAPKIPQLDGDFIMRIQELECENRELKREIVQLQKQNDDLGTLISYYENKNDSELVLEKF